MNMKLEREREQVAIAKLIDFNPDGWRAKFHYPASELPQTKLHSFAKA